MKERRQENYIKYKLENARGRRQGERTEKKQRNISETRHTKTADKKHRHSVNEWQLNKDRKTVRERKKVALGARPIIKKKNKNTHKQQTNTNKKERT